jgi:indole-3-acetate monooxygenase
MITNAARDRDALLSAAWLLVPEIRAAADAAERERRLPSSLLEALHAAGLFRLGVPRELGGAEADPLTTARVRQVLARADGSVGWCAMVASQSGQLASFLDQPAREEILGASTAVIASVFRPGGQATPA